LQADIRLLLQLLRPRLLIPPRLLCLLQLRLLILPLRLAL
jgi:hypothetical protein